MVGKLLNVLYTKQSTLQSGFIKAVMQSTKCYISKGTSGFCIIKAGLLNNMRNFTTEMTYLSLLDLIAELFVVFKREIQNIQSLNGVMSLP